MAWSYLTRGRVSGAGSTLITSGFSYLGKASIDSESAVLASSFVEVLKGAPQKGSYPVRSSGLDNPEVKAVLDMILTEGANLVEHNTYISLQGRQSQVIRTLSKPDWALVKARVLEVNQIRGH